MASSESDSYCAETDVVARAQYLSNFTTTTVPTEAQLLEFMAQRAAELYSTLRDVMGTDAVGPVSYANAIDNSTDAGKSLEYVLVQYNAIGAAMDALAAAGAGESPARSERIAELFALWSDRDTALRNAAMQYLGNATRSSTHISSGEITEATVTAREEDGMEFNGASEF